MTATRAAPAGAASGGYSFKSFGIIGLRNTYIDGINASGTFTGTACDATCTKTALFVDTDGRLTQFTIPLRGAVAKDASTSGIDGAGDVVGIWLDAHGAVHGFERSVTGTVTAVVDPQAVGTDRGGTSVAGISPGGVIVGSFTNAAGVDHGFVDRAGRFSTYDEPQAGAGGSTVVTFFDGGELGGYYVTSAGTVHGFYRRAGQAHTVSDAKVVARPGENATTVVQAIDSSGRLYGVVFGAGPAKSFIDRSGVFSLIRDPAEVLAPPTDYKATLDGTAVLNASPSGAIVGGYSYDKNGDAKGFIARPRD